MPLATPRLLPCLVLAVVALASESAVPTSAQGPTLPSYDLNVTIDYDSATVQADQATRFRNQTGLTLDRVVFQVAPAYFGALQLTAVGAQGQPADISLNGTVLEVLLPTPLGPGASVQIDLSYQITVPRQVGRFSAGPHALALGNWFPTLAPHRGDWDRHQYTDVGDAFVTEVANFDVRLSTSVPLAVASTGRTVEDNGTSFHIQAVGVRDFGLSLSPGYTIAEAQAGRATVRAFGLSRDRARLFADTGAKYLRWYGDRFGVYPYRTFSLAEVDLPASYGGMEYPSLILISSALGTPAPFEGSLTENLIGHETAHQWFYSAVGDDQVNDPWVDEAFAQYLPYYYYHATSPALFDAVWNDRVLAGLDQRIKAAGGLPVDSSVYDFPDDGPYFAIVYRQGAHFLDELRQTIGDAGFDAALADEVATFADKLASPRAVLDLFQRHSQANLNPLFAKYFSYQAFSDPAPPAWRVETPNGPLRGSASLFVGAEFPVTGVEAWLDSRRLYSGEKNAVTLDLSGVEPGDYVLLIRIWDHRGIQFDRARRVSVSGA